jgi:fucose 4-O-acetylase-like acetyltransferase
MPLLIFVSGYLSKIRPDNTKRAFKGLLVPYLIFDSLWILFIFLMDGTTTNLIYLLPEWGLWYLLSLFFWRTMLPAANKVKYIFWISIFLALIIGAFDFNLGFLSISRTLCFFPIFLLGFYFKDLKEKFTINKYLAGGALITLLTISTLYFMHHKAKLLYLKDSYSAMGMGNLEGMFLRLIIIAIGMISAVLLFNVMTSKETFLTKIGRNSLSVYILQFYFILSLPIILKYLGLSFIFHSYLLTTVYVVLATVVVTYILSQDTVKECLDILIKMVIEIILIKMFIC